MLSMLLMRDAHRAALSHSRDTTSLPPTSSGYLLPSLDNSQYTTASYESITSTTSLPAIFPPTAISSPFDSHRVLSDRQATGRHCVLVRSHNPTPAALQRIMQWYHDLLEHTHGAYELVLSMDTTNGDQHARWAAGL